MTDFDSETVRVARKQPVSASLPRENGRTSPDAAVDSQGEKVEMQINENQSGLIERSRLRMKQRREESRNKKKAPSNNLLLQDKPCTDDFLQRMVVDYKQVLIRQHKKKVSSDIIST